MSIGGAVIEKFGFVGGRLCLDFINTVDDHASDHPKEYLSSYAELVAWSQQKHSIPEEEALRLLEVAAQRPDEAATTLAAAISFREALYRVFLAALDGTTPAAADLAAFNAMRTQALASSEIAPAADGFAWRWTGDEQELGRMLWPVVLSATELLLSPDLKEIKECGGPGCGWLFLDTSKNHTRRWCTMEGCGNRAKARSHYQRKQQGAQKGG